MTDAAKAVGKTRGPQHGDVAPSFQMIADLWSVWINNQVATSTGKAPVQKVQLAPGDVLQMMSLLKKARALHGDATLADHYADDIGYTGLAGGIAGAVGGGEQVQAVEAGVRQALAQAAVDLTVDPVEVPNTPEPDPDPVPPFLFKNRNEKKAS